MLAFSVSAALLTVACGGSSPTTPSAPAPIPAADACGALGSTPGQRIDILSGAECANFDRAPIVKLNMRTADNVGLGGCTGTIVHPRVVLTAAHCLDEDVGTVRVWLGSGDEIVAQGFTYYPGYRFNQSGFDVGVIVVGQDLPRTPMPILTSRDGQVGETAIIAGYGRDDNNVTFALRAGSTTLSAVGALLQTIYAPPASSVCQGDSGGPILLRQNNVWAIAGITSATSGSVCNTGENFYQPVRNQSVLNFILQHVPTIGQR
ncbi:MAG: S1 family peptidase [Acidobacteriota bacterium]|nr:S1 family peptidase [Acidobacteriota bacterium]